MATDPADSVSVSGVGFGDYYRAHVGPLVALSLLRGADLVEAARLAQDAMTVARRWMDLLTANAAGAGVVKDTMTPVVTAQALRSWTCRMTIGGGCGVLRPVDGTVPALLGKGSTAALVQARTVVALAPLRELNERQLNVTAFRLAGCAPGAIGYELGLSMPKVHRTLHHVGKLLEAETGVRQARGAEVPGEAEESGAARGSAEADVRFAELLGELAAALDPVLDLRAGLDEVSGTMGAHGTTARRAPVPPLWNLSPSLPVPPFGAPVLHSLAEPAPSGVRAYAAGLAGCDALRREAALGGFPAAELAAVRLGAALALQVERFRREAERSGTRATKDEFRRQDARAFAVALAQDAALAAPMFDAVKDLDVPRRVGFLAAGLAQDDPWTIEVSYDGIEASLALARFRRAAVRAALRASHRPGAGTSPQPGGSLADALTQSLRDTHRMIRQLDELNSDLSRAESTLPDGYYVDMTRDFDLHQSFHADLALGIDAVREALSQP
ncbi:hypothetical protein [Streptomyces tanashiensis]|uniref:Uncharacterized protein n=1 Tax=Streptomyces tanashiensis TaxID=67367 RepID=A0ABY6RB04_9ACTN|nr:hypothetical protein [Streptomyces tanashiensis]UZX26808.1 hypothetical protein LDH80_39315 [Streptomyces tanashiensis]